ncbi:MAG: polysaccharide deacetylase family protein [Lachnospiraceae bacterium]|nr:polysaccharide deacetylase family protein [Lachnospiraceae bacterium]
MNSKTKKVIITSVICVALLAIISIIIIHFSYYKFSFTAEDGTSISNKSTLEVSVGTSQLPKVTALYTDLRSNKNGAAAETTMTGTADLNHMGEYVVSYTAAYEGKTKTIDITIKVVDKTAPTITLKGGNEITWPLDKDFADPGYSANDNVDGDLTSQITVEGTVDVHKEGSYTLTYKVADSSKNETVVTRTVNVKKVEEAQTINPGDKIVYLTFDDGPGPYTQKLLDILDKYNVKVTFFTTDAYPGHEYLLAEEAKRGHTVAIHTYSHEYNEIYSSVDAYFADLNKMKDLIKTQTGKEPKLMRFPGGSSNTVSKKYSPGIMTTLTQEVTNRGYLYDDWNVSSGDAGETTSTEQVVANVITGLQKNNVSHVLQHDIKEFSVNAVEQIIQWGQANGYKFLPLTETSPMTHHGILN